MIILLYYQHMHQPLTIAASLAHSNACLIASLAITTTNQ